MLNNTIMKKYINKWGYNLCFKEVPEIVIKPDEVITEKTMQKLPKRAIKFLIPVV
ncbi:MAG: hypothetical protein PHX09_04455 [Clostridia bacterium]|nr:hypothetical protein [Clostridia bacterium]